jgi:lysozyme
MWGKIPPSPPSPPSSAPPPKTPPKAPAFVAAAVLLATTALTIPSEGTRLRPYWDPAHIRTVCNGETKGVQERAYSAAECQILLEQRMARDYAPAIERCAPQVANDRRLKIFAALLDASYNAGTAAVCSSPMVARIKAGDLAGACGAFTAKIRVGPIVADGWFVTARYRGKPQPAHAMSRAGWHWTGKSWIKQLGGLVTRRGKEARLCLQGATA